MASYAATFQNLQDAVIAKLNLDATADLTAVKAWINWAYADVCNDSEALQTTGTLALTAGTANYDLSTVASGAILRVKAMYVTAAGATQSPPLAYVSLADILRRRTSAGSGTPTHYTLDGLNRLELYPTPAAADVLSFYYSYLPTLLSANGDLQVLGEPWSKMLEAGALAEAADFVSDPLADQYRVVYEGWKGRFRAHLQRRATVVPRRLGGDYVGAAGLHDPSADVR